MSEIAILIPCYNEAVTIGKVVDDFKREVPEATIYVYDNASSDDTAQIACDHGAVVRHEKRRGKGNVTRQMFREIEADCYVMVDGDATYPAQSVRELIKPVLADEADMVVGDRMSTGAYAEKNTRALHGFGNGLVCWLINKIYRSDLNDIMSGYRAFSRLFVKTYPVVSSGFEVETEMSIHALDKGFRIVQAPIAYYDRPQGSYSKLSTLSDGLLVLKTIASLCREYRPMFFFNMLALVSLVVCLACGLPVIGEYFETAYITHVPLAVAAVGFGIVCLLFFMCGLILDSLRRTARKQYELEILNYCSKNR
jgi:glycosyltransferase involved in cell wall biosynthesis